MAKDNNVTKLPESSSAVADAPKRRHRATYTSDKRTGGYLIRVIGPDAAKFLNRDVPVTLADGTEHAERLIKLVHTGVDEGKFNAADKGQTYALYKFQPKPRDEKQADF